MRERIKQLAGEFVQRCSRDVSSLRASLTRLGNGDSMVFDAIVFKEMEHIAHRICGTGASLGFESLSTCAAAIERHKQAIDGFNIIVVFVFVAAVMGGLAPGFVAAPLAVAPLAAACQMRQAGAVRWDDDPDRPPAGMGRRRALADRTLRARGAGA